jgi:K+ transporter
MRTPCWQTESEILATDIETQALHIDAAVKQLTAHNPAPVVRTAVSLLVKLLGNIQAQPGEAKFRRLRKSNTHLAAKVLW